MFISSYPDIHDTRRCPHGKQMDDYCEPCEAAEQAEVAEESAKQPKCTCADFDGFINCPVHI